MCASRWSVTLLCPTARNFMAAPGRYEWTESTRIKQQHTFGRETVLIIALRPKRRWAVNVVRRGFLLFHNIVMSLTDRCLLRVLLELQVHLFSEW